jgi:hypothetical protein
VDRPTLVRPVLHRAADVARMLRCSEWWVKEQARNRRIPYSFIGGSYRFTDQHVVEIVKLFEVRPQETEEPAPLPRRSAAQGRAGNNGKALHRLTARTPRRVRMATLDTAV